MKKSQDTQGRRQGMKDMTVPKSPAAFFELEGM